MTLNDVAALLSASRIDPEKIKQTLHQAASELLLPAPPWNREHVFALLDNIASQGGILAISARFAKARLLLKR
jgi:hypothetical protein